MKKLKSNIVKAALVGVVMSCLGCYHSLEVINIDQYRKTVEIDKKQEGLAISLIPKNGSQSEAFFHYVAREMKAQGGYNVSVLGGADESDLIIDIAYSCDESSDWANFFVCMPGFVIFTHAWLGYGYEYKAMWNVTAFDRNTQKMLFRQPIEMKIEFRYAQLGTTWANAVGLCLIGIGWPAVNGVCVLHYDRWATVELLKSTQDVMAKYLARQLSQKINKAMAGNADE